jgi:hypothetical protein
VDTLAAAVAAAEVMARTPEYEALVCALQVVLEPASLSHIKRELGVLFACYPAKDVDISVLVACAVEDVIAEQPSVLRLLFAVRCIRRECKFRPSIAEILDALDDVGSVITEAKQIVELPKRLDEAVLRLPRLVNDELNRIKELLSDRERRVDGGKTVKPIDAELKVTRSNLARVLVHRVTALEPQRPLITQSVSITENEKVTVPW